jgi:hypothetical protein
MPLAQPRYSLFPARQPIVGKRANHFRPVATQLHRRNSWRMAVSVYWIRVAAMHNRPEVIEATLRSEPKARRPSEWSLWIDQPWVAVPHMKAKQFRQPLPQELCALSSPKVFQPGTETRRQELSKGHRRWHVFSVVSKGRRPRWWLGVKDKAGHPTRICLRSGVAAPCLGGLQRVGNKQRQGSSCHKQSSPWCRRKAPPLR